jgi:hypothetical protein
LPGVNCRVRTKQHREPHVVITCLACGGHMRFQLKPRKEKDQREQPTSENTEGDRTLFGESGARCL